VDEWCSQDDEQYDHLPPEIHGCRLLLYESLVKTFSNSISPKSPVEMSPEALIEMSRKVIKILSAVFNFGKSHPKV